jgi:L,D-peptidoglycan transpeptidase YkuD (ErfK/YbiS/YcfS/YnhG family)
MRRKVRLAQNRPEKTRKRPLIKLLTISDAASKGFVEFENLRFPAAIGRAGVRALKLEGDGATPRGTWKFLYGYYRAGRIKRPVTGLPLKPLRPSSGWSDAPGDRNYNRPVKLPYPLSHETLWRGDHLYDLIVVLDYNFRRRCSGRGSAIFMHLAEQGYSPTAGCVALKREHLLRLLGALPRRGAISMGRR